MERRIEAIAQSPAGDRSIGGAGDVGADPGWRDLYRLGGMAGLGILVMMPVQVILYVMYPPPETVIGYFDLMQENPIIGLICLDLLYMVTMILAGLVVLAISVALRRVGRSLVAVALFLTVAGTAVYFSSSVAFEMLNLSNQYAAATTETGRERLLAAGEGMLATYQGSAFNVSYILAAVAGLILATVMLRGDIFSRKTAYTGIIMNMLMLIPPTAGTVGLALAFASLVPTAVWMVLIVRRLHQLGRDGEPTVPRYVQGI